MFVLCDLATSGIAHMSEISLRKSELYLPHLSEKFTAVGFVAMLVMM